MAQTQKVGTARRACLPAYRWVRGCPGGASLPTAGRQLFPLFLFLSLFVPGAWAHAQSARPGLGSIPYADTNGTGVTFRVWAPHASSVGVKGQFNGWATTPMVEEASGGLWSIDVEGAVAGQEYKYVINNSLDRRDPRARRVTHSAGNSVVYNTGAFDWQGIDGSPPWLNDLVIYEMHVGTFNAEDWLPSTFDEAIEKLEHLEKLGVSAVQVMPINEYATDRSWGYNPSDLFAIESSLGGPDGFKRFVRECHRRGIAVLVDVVHNHYGPSDLSLWQFDGWSQNGLGGIYFYNDNRAYTLWGSTRPDYGRAEVRAFIRDQIFTLLDEYRVDGFRWDSVFTMLYSDGGTLGDAESLLRDINWEIQNTHPGTIRIAEDHAFDFNMNFDTQWDVGYARDLRWQVNRSSDADRNMYWLADLVRNNASHARVVFSESHDEVGDLNDKHRLPYEIDSGDPESIWARRRQLLAASVVMTTPGIPMLMQGQEMNEWWQFSSNSSVRWDLTNTWSGIVRAYSDLIHVRRNLYGGTQGLKGTGVTAHHIDNGNKVLAYIRWDAGGGVDDVVVVCNFSATTWNGDDYFIEFPAAGTWYSHFNGDASIYAADFGGVGDAQVVASGSPATAAVNMGPYSCQIFSLTPPPSAGEVVLDPAVPTGCVEVVISFDPLDGPLDDSTQVVASVGINGFQDLADLPMTQEVSGAWSGTYLLPEETETLDMAFNNGATNDTAWDNNKGDDWHFGVEGCANRPSFAEASPSNPQGCVPVTITYEQRSGVLKDTTNVNLYLGRNGWQDIGTYPMTESTPGQWAYTHVLPDDTWQLDFVFNGSGPSNTVWDNNGGNDWVVYVADCIDPLFPGIVITNPSTDITVDHTISNMNLRGRVTGNIEGDLRWSNSLTGASGMLPADDEWSLAGLGLGEGPNVIRLTGTNGTVNPNDGAWDTATNNTYTAGPSWTSGQDGGSNWGGGWQLSDGANSGYFLAEAAFEANLDSGTNAWGLWAHSGDLSAAVRPFKTRMNVGDVFRARFENNWCNGVVGMGLQNRFGQNLFELIFVGGGTNYLVNDRTLSRPTALPYTADGIDLVFELTSTTTYELDAGGMLFTGVLASSSEAVIDRVRFFNYEAGDGPEFNLYLNYVSMEGDPVPSGQYDTEVTITRAYGPYSDPDKDGYLTWEEEFAGTDPFSRASKFPEIEVVTGTQEADIEIAETYPAKWYGIFASTNLSGGIWEHATPPRQGSGAPLVLSVTNGQGITYYRTGVFAP